MKYTIKSPPSVYREDNYKTKKQTKMQFKKKSLKNVNRQFSQVNLKLTIKGGYMYHFK